MSLRKRAFYLLVFQELESLLSLHILLSSVLSIPSLVAVAIKKVLFIRTSGKQILPQRWISRVNSQYDKFFFPLCGGWKISTFFFYFILEIDHQTINGLCQSVSKFFIQAGGVFMEFSCVRASVLQNK